MILKEIFEKIFNSLSEFVTEVTAIRKRSVRKGKVIRRRDCPPGYRLVKNRCVRMASRERLKRKRAGKRAARKSKAARRRTFKRSIRLRQRRKLKRKSFRR